MIVLGTRAPLQLVRPSGTNQQRIDAILQGRTPPNFTYGAYPADPVTTRQVTVNSASEFNTEAAIAGTEITVGSSFPGDVEIRADDIDVIMPNNLSIDGSLWVDGPFSTTIRRIRWTGGNVRTCYVGGTEDVLFDDFRCIADESTAIEIGAQNQIGFGGTATNLFFINSTLEVFGTDPLPGNWAWAIVTRSDNVPRNSGLALLNTKVQTNALSQMTRFQSDNIMICDSVFNPDGIGANAMRFHVAATNVWVKDSWSRGLMKIDFYGEGDVGPSMVNGLFDNYDRYFSAYANYFWDNTGEIRNSTLHWTSPVTFDYGTLTDGGGNAVNGAWDGATVPDYSTVGAIRP